MEIYPRAEDYFEALEQIQFTANDQVVPSGQRPCPICKKFMTTQKLHDITMDVCPNHGVWLDGGELQTLIARARPGQKRK